MQTKEEMGHREEAFGLTYTWTLSLTVDVSPCGLLLAQEQI